MATGMEMVMLQLRKLIPDHVWEAVEKNLFSMGEKVKAIDDRLAKIEADQAEILKLLHNRLPIHYENKPRPLEGTDGSQPNGHG